MLKAATNSILICCEAILDLVRGLGVPVLKHRASSGFLVKLLTATLCKTFFGSKHFRRSKPCSRERRIFHSTRNTTILRRIGTLEAKQDC